MIQVTGYSTREIMARAGVTRDAVSKWARRYKWETVSIGNANVYASRDVDKFLAARLRRKLMQAAGWIDTNTLIYADDWDRDCPRCGGFAVERPAKPGETQDEKWMVGEIDFVCVNCGLMPQEG